ncbi:Mitochondrial import receptor subunit TOM40-like protein [Sciurus carolinensis]|uniref:Mitochondrial import receptor subunit TOM40-like protein n=1 Tax=Sciurus carolinensis TaxID=30640 RepID=A0AA41NE66_SCICA|nr:Mitochondrial import receptor subunit TOM40-like protein [Sciurus carolinensis]
MVAAAAAGSVARGARGGSGAQTGSRHHRQRPWGTCWPLARRPQGRRLHLRRPSWVCRHLRPRRRASRCRRWEVAWVQGPAQVEVRNGPRTPGAATVSAAGVADDDGACGCLPNPGTFEECHQKYKELFPIQMEGVKLTVNKGLSNHFQVNHTVALSTIGGSNYHFGVTYVGTKQLSPTEASPVLVGDMDNSGSLNAQVIHQLGPGLRSKMAIQTQQAKFVNWQVDREYRGSDFTAAVTLGNPDVLVGSGILMAHYLQSITPCLALGGELVYHRRPGEEGTVMSLAGKYTLNNGLATVTLGQAGMHATYYHKASDQLQVGVEFEAGTRMQDTSVSFGYQLDLPKANLLFKGSVDSNWIVGATLEKKLPAPDAGTRGLPEPPQAQEQVPVRLRANHWLNSLRPPSSLPALPPPPPPPHHGGSPEPLPFLSLPPGRGGSGKEGTHHPNS